MRLLPQGVQFLMGNVSCLIVLLSSILVCALLWAQLSRKQRKLQQALLPAMSSFNSRVAKPFIAFGRFKNTFLESSKWTDAAAKLYIQKLGFAFCWLINTTFLETEGTFVNFQCWWSVSSLPLIITNITAHQCNQHFWPDKRHYTKFILAFSHQMTLEALFYPCKNIPWFIWL